MQTKFSFLCDSANVSKSNTFNVLGIFTNINSMTFPLTLTKFTYVASILFHPSEAGIHSFKLTFIDYGGKELIPPITGEIKVSPVVLTTNMLLEIHNVSFPKAGTYQLDLTVDNLHISTESLFIRHVNKTDS